MVLCPAVALQAVLLRLVVPPVTVVTIDPAVLVLTGILAPRFPGASRRLVEAVTAWHPADRLRRRV